MTGGFEVAARAAESGHAALAKAAGQRFALPAVATRGITAGWLPSQPCGRPSAPAWTPIRPTPAASAASATACATRGATPRSKTLGTM